MYLLGKRGRVFFLPHAPRDNDDNSGISMPIPTLKRLSRQRVSLVPRAAKGSSCTIKCPSGLVDLVDRNRLFGAGARPAFYKKSFAATGWQLEAILCERVLLEGCPELRIVGRLAGILEDEIDNPGSRDTFWHDARGKLGKLHRLSQRNIGQIEIMIGARIAKPVPKPQPALKES